MHIGPYATSRIRLDALMNRYVEILVIGYKVKHLLQIPLYVCDPHLNLREEFGKLG